MDFDLLCDESHYDILGIDKDASDDEIKKAFKKMIIKYHPDKLRKGEKVDKDLFMKINESYRILSNKKLKQEHDDQLLFGPEKNTASDYGMSIAMDILGKFLHGNVNEMDFFADPTFTRKFEAVFRKFEDEFSRFGSSNKEKIKRMRRGSKKIKLRLDKLSNNEHKGFRQDNSDYLIEALFMYS
jgi:DnaJ-class molecular chaperone